MIVVVLGAVIVLVDGQLIMRASPSYLLRAFPDPARARQVAGLVTVLFDLVMVGVVFLISSGTTPNAGPPAVLSRIGVVLILTALVHGSALYGMSRLREREVELGTADANRPARAKGDSPGPGQAEATRTGPTPEHPARETAGSGDGFDAEAVSGSADTATPPASNAEVHHANPTDQPTHDAPRTVGDLVEELERKGTMPESR